MPLDPKDPRWKTAGKQPKHKILRRVDDRAISANPCVH